MNREKIDEVLLEQVLDELKLPHELRNNVREGIIEELSK